MIKRKKGKLALLLFFTIVLFACKTAYGQYNQDTLPAYAPKLAVKTNLLYDVTTTFNLGVEFYLDNQISLDVPVSYNPWIFSNSKKWKHILVQPELRWWMKETFRGTFIGIHAHYAFYNVGGLDNPPFSKYMNAHRFEGWLAGVGVSYGYSWNFSQYWGMEASLGIGYAYLDYDKFECSECGKKLGSETRNYLGPTKAGITLIYNFSRKKKSVK